MKTPTKKHAIIVICAATLLFIISIWAILRVLPKINTPSSSKINIVASTNVWGDIASQVGGDHVAVTSILNDPGADPHLFESDAKTASSLANAQLVIVNGLGYDEFMDKLLSAGGKENKTVLSISDVLQANPDANPHLWYDLPRIKEVAVAIQDNLIKIDPVHTSQYQANTQAFIASLDPLTQKLQQINKTYGGNGAAYTERVAGYLLEDAGLVDKTPTDFAAAVENGTDPTPQQVQSFKDELTSGSVKVLIYNNQAVNDMTEQVQTTANSAKVGVVGVSETIPAGKTFQTWQLEQLDALLVALQK